MTTTVLTPRRAAGAQLRLAAWSLIAGALLQVVLGIPLAPLQAYDPPLAAIPALNAVSHLLLMAGVAGLARSGVAGRSRLAVVGLALTLLGLAVLVVAEVSWLTQAGVAETLYGIATLAMTLGLLLAGAAVARAGRWTGWRRFTLLACGLFIPLVLFPSFALPGLAMNYAIGLWGICWLLLGLALLAESS